MEFSTNLLHKIESVFEEYNFRLETKSRSGVVFKSGQMSILISYNKYEGTINIFVDISPNCIDTWELTDDVMKEVFSFDYKNWLDEDKSISLVEKFFTTSGLSLLRQEPVIIEKLRAVVLIKQKEYNYHLLYYPLLAEADIAWKSGDKTEFLRLLENVPDRELPSSYQLKKKIALKK